MSDSFHVSKLVIVAKVGFEPTRPFGPMLLRHRCLASSITRPFSPPGGSRTLKTRVLNPICMPVPSPVDNYSGSGRARTFKQISPRHFSKVLAYLLAYASINLSSKWDSNPHVLSDTRLSFSRGYQITPSDVIIDSMRFELILYGLSCH